MFFESLLLIAAIGSQLCANYITTYDSISTDSIEQYSSVNKNYINSLISEDSIQECATITVLMHGLGSSFKDYIIDNGSTIDLLEGSLAKNLQRAQYRFDGMTNDVMTLDQNIYLINGCGQYLYKLSPYNSQYKINQINFSDINIDENILLIYSEETETNEMTSIELSNQVFEFTINQVVAEVGRLQGDVLPKINLIGHSRGGMTICDYATKYPQIINALFPISSPLGYMTYGPDLYDLGLLFGLDLGNEQSYLELFDEEEKYNNCLEFNEVASNFYSRAIAFSQTSSFLQESLLDAISSQIPEGNNSVQYKIIDFFLTNLTAFITDFSQQNAHDIVDAIGYLPSKIKYGNISEYSELIISILHHLIDDFESSVVYGNIFKFDSLVNYSAALGYCAYYDSNEMKIYSASYDFDSVDMICVGSEIGGDYYDFSNLSEINAHKGRTNMPAVAHNLETKSTALASLIVSDLNQHGGFHKHSFTQSYNESHHFMQCSCGALKNKSSHLINIVYNDTNHTISCDEPLCNYEVVVEHNLHFIDNGDTHTRKCSVCDYEQYTESHDYGLYINKGHNGHQVICICGAIEGFYPHILVNNSCIYCLYKRTNGSGGIIITPPPGGGGILKEDNNDEIS